MRPHQLLLIVLSLPVAAACSSSSSGASGATGGGGLSGAAGAGGSGTAGDGSGGSGIAGGGSAGVAGAGGAAECVQPSDSTQTECPQASGRTCCGAKGSWFKWHPDTGCREPLAPNNGSNLICYDGGGPGLSCTEIPAGSCMTRMKDGSLEILLLGNTYGGLPGGWHVASEADCAMYDKASTCM